MDINELLEKNRKLLSKKKKSHCKRCGDSIAAGTHCSSCMAEREAEAAKKKAGRTVTGGRNYVYAYDEVTGKPRLAARMFMENYLGRSLQGHEIVLYRDGNRQNVSLDNLELGLKAGIPASKLKCPNCGHHGMELDN